VGGNHLIDGESRVWTVDEEGGLHRTDRQVSALPEIQGKSWMRFPGGGVWSIDQQGAIKGEIQLVTGAQGVLTTSSFFESIDPNSVFQPRIDGGER
jgi:hypothetical protein